MCWTSGVTQNLCDCAGERGPALLFVLELPASRRGDLVIARTPAVLRLPPFRTQAPGVRHAVQRRIERPFFDAQHAVRDAADVLGDRVAVHRTTGFERLEDDEIQGALKTIVGVLWWTLRHRSPASSGERQCLTELAG